jgi:hypothetical protein
VVLLSCERLNLENLFDTVHMTDVHTSLRNVYLFEKMRLWGMVFYKTYGMLIVKSKFNNWCYILWKICKYRSSKVIVIWILHLWLTSCMYVIILYLLLTSCIYGVILFWVLLNNTKVSYQHIILMTWKIAIVFLSWQVLKVQSFKGLLIKVSRGLNRAIQCCMKIAQCCITYNFHSWLIVNN